MSPTLTKPLTAAQFRRLLRAIVPPADSPDALLWPSESDKPVRVVNLPDSRVIKWESKSWGVHNKPYRADHWINGLLGEEDTDPRFEQLAKLFKPHSLNSRVFYRLTDEQSVYDLYLLVRFGGRWIGLRTKVVET